MNHSPIILSDSSFTKKLGMIGLVATAVGGGLSILAATMDWQRFIFNYLVAFVFVGGIAVTGIFFSTVMYLVRAGWSAAVRRIPEFIAAFVPFLILMMIPIVLGVGDLYHHWVHPEPGDTLLAGKANWLNVPFFVIRLAVYYLIWLGMYFFIVGNSFRQDKTTDPTPTKRNWTFSAPVMILYALSMTFAAFDLLMSLYPHWYSTMFGVYYFSGSLVGCLALIAILMVSLKRAGHFTEWLTPDRFHDLGKLLFAFNVFWAYIGFSQYLLIWYANLPEETIFFTYRMSHGWEYVSWAILLIHFIIPFIILLSQASKKSLNGLLTGAIILLVAHFIDMSWLIMPYYNHDAVPLSWFEIVPTLAVGGIFLLVLSMQFKRKNLLPINDPFLREAKH
jgi:hypothetical protein